MPNWCYSNIYISGDKSEVEKLHGLILKWTAHEAMPSDFGCMWLGNIVINSGILEGKPFDNCNILCRGWIDCIDLETEPDDNKAQLRIDQGTAWGPMNYLWEKIIDKYYPNLNFEYEAEEPGNGIYVTTLPEIAGTYVLEIENEDTLYNLSESDCLKTLKEYLIAEHNFSEKKLSGSTISKCISFIEDLDLYVNCNQYKYDDYPFES